MKIYHWCDEEQVSHFYTSHREAVRHLRWLQTEGETATPVSSIKESDAIELLEELSKRNSELELQVDRLENQ